MQKVSARRKRNTAGFPNKISDYDKAGCGGTSGCYYITAQLKNEEVDFTIGDDEMYDGFKNAKLEPSTTYNIYVRGLSYNSMKVGDLSHISLILYRKFLMNCMNVIGSTVRYVSTE